jgi:hypothetical protein
VWQVYICLLVLGAVWQVYRRYLLVLGAWSHLCYIKGPCWPHFQIWISGISILVTSVFGSQGQTFKIQRNLQCTQRKGFPNSHVLSLWESQLLSLIRLKIYLKIYMSCQWVCVPWRNVWKKTLQRLSLLWLLTKPLSFNTVVCINKGNENCSVSNSSSTHVSFKSSRDL